MMAGTTGQLLLDLPQRPALGAEDFFISRSNHAAAEIVDRWPDWPQGAVMLVAPPGAGKTHLANVWRLRSGAARLESTSLSEADVARLAGAHALVVEDLHAGIAQEHALFHLLNRARAGRLSMLITSRLGAGALPVRLPDLASRLRAVPAVAIGHPDQALLRAVLVKHFTDRQLAVEPHVIGYLALRMEQSLEAAAAIVADIDRLALATHRRVTRALAAEALSHRQREAS
jgi:chromosomal replication initiation ATPase DnaA